MTGYVGSGVKDGMNLYIEVLLKNNFMYSMTYQITFNEETKIYEYRFKECKHVEVKNDL